jgi:hypothetical protein
MITKLAKTIFEVFPLSKIMKQTQQSRLENYLESKNVKSTSDIEYWTREFERKQDKFYNNYI